MLVCFSMLYHHAIMTLLFIIHYLFIIYLRASSHPLTQEQKLMNINLSSHTICSHLYYSNSSANYLATALCLMYTSNKYISKEISKI